MERVLSELVVLILFIGILYNAKNVTESDYEGRKGTWRAYYSEEAKPVHEFFVKMISLIVIIVIGSLLFSDFLLLFIH